MALISLRQLLDHAAENDYGVPQFNVNNLEQVRAIMEGAACCKQPSYFASFCGRSKKHAGSNFLKHLIQGAIEEFPHTNCNAPGPWSFACSMSAFNSAWFFLSYDGWLSCRGRKDANRF